MDIINKKRETSQRLQDTIEQILDKFSATVILKNTVEISSEDRIVDENNITNISLNDLANKRAYEIIKNDIEEIVNAVSNYETVQNVHEKLNDQVSLYQYYFKHFSDAFVKTKEKLQQYKDEIKNQVQILEDRIEQKRNDINSIIDKIANRNIFSTLFTLITEGLTQLTNAALNQVDIFTNFLSIIDLKMAPYSIGTIKEKSRLRQAIGYKWTPTVIKLPYLISEDIVDYEKLIWLKGPFKGKPFSIEILDKNLFDINIQNLNSQDFNLTLVKAPKNKVFAYTTYIPDEDYEDIKNQWNQLVLSSTLKSEKLASVLQGKETKISILQPSDYGIFTGLLTTQIGLAVGNVWSGSGSFISKIISTVLVTTTILVVNLTNLTLYAIQNREDLTKIFHDTGSRISLEQALINHFSVWRESEHSSLPIELWGQTLIKPMNIFQYKFDLIKNSLTLAGNILATTYLSGKLNYVVNTFENKVKRWNQYRKLVKTQERKQISDINVSPEEIEKILKTQKTKGRPKKETYYIDNATLLAYENYRKSFSQAKIGGSNSVSKGNQLVPLFKVRKIQKIKPSFEVKNSINIKVNENYRRLQKLNQDQTFMVYSDKALKNLLTTGTKTTSLITAKAALTTLGLLGSLGLGITNIVKNKKLRKLQNKLDSDSFNSKQYSQEDLNKLVIKISKRLGIL